MLLTYTYVLRTYLVETEENRTFKPALWWGVDIACNSSWDKPGDMLVHYIGLTVGDSLLIPYVDARTAHFGLVDS